MKDAILKAVLSAMDQAEGMGGPEGQDYLDLMAQIAKEAVTRIENFNSWHTAAWVHKQDGR